MNGYTSLRLESGTAEMSADSVVLDSDMGLFSDGSVSVDSVFEDLGLYSEGENDDILVEEAVSEDAAEEPSDVETEENLPSEPKDIICKKGKGIVNRNLQYL